MKGETIIHRNDIASILANIVGISSLASDEAFAAQISALFGANGKTILAMLGVAGVIAAQIIRILSVPTVDATATAVVAVPAANTISTEPSQIETVPAKADVPPTQ